MPRWSPRTGRRRRARGSGPPPAAPRTWRQGTAPRTRPPTEGAVHVVLSGEQQDGGLAGGERRTSGLRVEGTLGREESDSFLVPRPAGCMVLLCRGVPAAAEEGGGGLPVAARALGDRLQGGERGREPRLVLPKLRELESRLPGDRYTDSSGTGADQGELADLLRVPGRVLRRNIRAGGVAEQVHPGKPEVYAQRLDVIDQVIAAVGRGVLGNRGPAGAAQVQDDKPTVRGQAAEVAEVDGVRGTPREADDRVAVSDHAVGEPGSVRCGEGRHEANPANNNQVIATGVRYITELWQAKRNRVGPPRR